MLLNVEDHRVRARRSLPRFVFDFLDGGADDEVCLRRNRSRLEDIRLQPQCLRDVSRIDTSVSLFGQTWQLPLAVAPTGFNGLLRPGGDLALARAAARAGIPFTLSTASNERIETVGQAAHGIKWFQLYVMGERRIAEQMLARAREAGFSALVLTVDVPVSGNREKDVRNGFTLPLRPSPRTLLNLCRHPRWLARQAIHGTPSFVNLAAPEGASASAQAALMSRAMDRSLVWDSLKWLRTHWNGPILLKGVLSAQDAALALRHGVDGIIVSNHGGRQLDAAPATIEVLPAIADAIKGRVPLLVDSGFRRGSDIVKALALGANAVLVGRPLLYGLAGGGEGGASAVLDILATELQRSMTLIGAASIGDIGSHHLWPATHPAHTIHPAYPVQAAAPADPAQQGVRFHV